MYQLRATPINATHRVSRRVREDATLQSSAPTALLQVVVADTGSGSYVSQLPASLLPLPSFLQNLSVADGDTAEYVVFSEHGMGGQGTPRNPPSFFLGTAANPQQQFNADQPLFTMPLGGTQRWKVINTSNTGINHPFHIHINPFQVEYVFAPAGAADPNYTFYQAMNLGSQNGSPYWFDTFPLPIPDAAGTPGYIVIQQKYADFAGAFVMHCHILGHEERGMMQRVDVTTPSPFSGAGSPAAPPPGGGHAHQH